NDTSRYKHNEFCGFVFFFSSHYYHLIECNQQNKAEKEKQKFIYCHNFIGSYRKAKIARSYEKDKSENMTFKSTFSTKKKELKIKLPTLLYIIRLVVYIKKKRVEN